MGFRKHSDKIDVNFLSLLFTYCVLRKQFPENLKQFIVKMVRKGLSQRVVTLKFNISTSDSVTQNPLQERRVSDDIK